MRLVTLLICLVISIPPLYPQSPKPYTSSEIYHAVKKLNFLGTALYIAAHPDDENTQMISYLSNEVHARTAYLSLTRGDGGQNLIGTELRELLGVIRTQELLAARRIDGGEQLFSRANDFGFSKYPDETFNIWDKDSVLADVVLAIRKFRPDIIINRFDHRSPGTTHGHHTASAMLSVEAFGLSADTDSYPGQLAQLQPWQPKRLFFNTSWWFYGSQDKFEEASKKGLIAINIGKYYPELGKSNGEIAALSRSQHRSQGFGSPASRGSSTEYLELLKGDRPGDNDLFAGINTTWSRIDGTEEIAKLLKSVEHHFDFGNPASHLPQLVKAYTLIRDLKDPYWKKLKTRQIKDIILACAGLYLEASTTTPQASPGTETIVRIEAINRSHADIRLEHVDIVQAGTEKKTDLPLPYNREKSLELAVPVPEQAGYSAPYWLTHKGTTGMYRAEKKYIGLPETPSLLTAGFRVIIEGTPLDFRKDVVYKYTDPARGERYQPFQILPPVTASTGNDVNIFRNTPKTIPVKVKAITGHIDASVSLDIPDGWSVTPDRIPLKLENRGEEKTVIFNVAPPEKESEGIITPIVHINGKKYDRKLAEINYDHIPFQSVLLPAEAKVVNLDLKKAGHTVGYIPGAGDKIPESLRQLGYQVSTIDITSISKASLSGFDAVVVGIRAYNVFPSLYTRQAALLDYVKSGGTLIVQYNTVGRSNTTDVKPPYPFRLSRDRVTDENAKVTLLDREHPILNTPNKIGPADFEGWVQERGLYFPDQWAEEYHAPLSMHDTGENPKEGSLLVAPYGKGYYIYTGLSFFRELPAGVPGAFKLFTNMLSIGKQKANSP
ncbi:PIG-L family deacetylase [Sinomicrobium soli]|uniref:PIG-L family deacetylase n=1 Tax=Sinomicrobium sp. N-1-3-6 TaxID=2219864 RepID=UPI000DCEE7E8|nr:PIG-L family deacetylase [Sinomicrobium sp. N-1-3-6]RAV28223.1 LmbE family protein [Sinomicrobium sp. N-1-3-6]